MAATTRVEYFPLLIAAAALLALVVSSSTDEPRPPTHASTPREPAPGEPLPAAASALLGGLKLGERIGDWQVKKLGITKAKQLEVALYRGEVGFAIWVAKKAADAPLPPRETARYALYYGGATHVDQVSGEIFQAALEDIARRVQQNEAAAGDVPGL